MKRRVLSAEGKRRVRMGRKAVSCGRIQTIAEKRAMASSTNDSAQSSAKKSSANFAVMLRKLRPYALGAIVLAALIGVSVGGYTLYAQHQEKARLAEEHALAEEARVESVKATTCLKNRMAGSDDGGVTFAELYKNACDE